MGGRNENEPYAYTQPGFGGFEIEEAPKPEETELTNCLVLSWPQYKKTGKKQEWIATVHAQPSIFQPDIDTVFLASAIDEQATQARKEGLKPGDRVIIRGVVSSQVVPLQNGETLSQIGVTDIQVVSREKRISTTAYEQKRARKRLR